MNKVSLSQKSVYGAGIASQNILYNFMSMYIMFFFTDLLGIPSGTATIIIVVASVWDSINDPFMGLLVDKTNTRIGKFRPYLIGGSFFLLLTTIACFSSFTTSPTAIVAVATISYILWGMSYTVSDIPIWALSSAVSTDNNQTTKMITVGKVAGTIGTAVCVVASVELLNLFGGTRDSNAFLISAIIIGGIAFIGILSVGLFVKEAFVPVSHNVSMKNNLKTLTKNKSLISLLIALFVINSINGIRQATQIYFTIYAWGSDSYVTLIGIVLIIGMVIGMLVSPILINKFEKKSILIISCIVGAVVNFLPYFSLQNVTLGLITMGISFATVGIMTIVSMSMLIDGIDYSEKLLGYRSEGIVFSLNTFATKLSAAFSKLVLGVCLVLMNYQENQPVTDTSISWFSALVYIVPSVASILTVVIISQYKIDSLSAKKTREELEILRSKNSSN